MTKEEMKVKMDEFIMGNDCYNGFTAYRAYCAVFGLAYDDVVTLESEDMCFDEFIDWLECFMYCHYDDYRVVDIFGSTNIIFCRLD